MGKRPPATPTGNADDPRRNPDVRPPHSERVRETKNGSRYRRTLKMDRTRQGNVSRGPRSPPGRRVTRGTLVARGHVTNPKRRSFVKRKKSRPYRISARLRIRNRSRVARQIQLSSVHRVVASLDRSLYL